MEGGGGMEGGRVGGMEEGTSRCPLISLLITPCSLLLGIVCMKW